jgi:hypothetical protein
MGSSMAGSSDHDIFTSRLGDYRVLERFFKHCEEQFLFVMDVKKTDFIDSGLLCEVKKQILRSSVY